MFILDQSFSSKELKKIYDSEKRKGFKIEDKYPSEYSEVISINQDLSILRKERATLYVERKRLMSRNLDTTKIDSEIIEKHNEIDETKDHRELKIIKVLDLASKKMQEKAFNPNIRIQYDSIKKKSVYIVDNHCTFLCVKKLQNTISRLYKIKQSDRNQIISSLSVILPDHFPKRIIKADIKHFYESIDFERLYSTLDKDGLLSHSSKNLIKEIINQYRIASGTSLGLPRGLGISAYLSELYMRDFDNYMRQMSGVYYYARYVDDIVLITMDNQLNYLSQMRKLLSKKALELNMSKYKCSNVPEKKDRAHFSWSVDYLGYCLKYNLGDFSLDLSSEKIKKYKEKIDVAFKDHLSGHHHEKSAKNLLIKRIRYLTHNTRLFGKKSNVVVGISSSNKYITGNLGLSELDGYLGTKIATLSPGFLSDRLSEFSFSKGFEDKSTNYLKDKRLFKDHLGKDYEVKENRIKKVTKIWKYV